ncbi:MAG: radical SAM-associated putative lipoprotein [Dysgonamonadaceae bacterium]|jgi:putative lipoprotein (rSAM/lipoprotein system)|nr:radical SAM-associated putative lipoprotein [Dysgonamonadaceae bacterium]
MKKLYHPLIKVANGILAGILTVLGFSSCEDIGNGNGRVEYGTPNADYTVKGTVVDKASKKPVKGIRVGYSPAPRIVPMYGVIPTEYMERASTTTDDKGEFKITENLFPGEENPVSVYIEDIDGEENGSFVSDTLMIDFRNANQTGKKDNWYQGEYTVTVNVELTEQETNE